MEYTLQDKVIKEKSFHKRARGIHQERCRDPSKRNKTSPSPMEKLPLDHLYPRKNLPVDKKNRD
jgi:hypothetical protein